MKVETEFLSYTGHISGSQWPPVMTSRERRRWMLSVFLRPEGQVYKRFCLPVREVSCAAATGSQELRLRYLVACAVPLAFCLWGLV